MSTRCPACGEFIGDNTFGKSPQHKCGAVINWNAVEPASTDPRDAQIAALTEKLRAVEAERDEWKRKYETQCAGSMSAHERRIHLEADLSALRAELERKDAALREVLVGDSNISAWGRRIIEAALENLENNDGK